jgi:protein gp37
MADTSIEWTDATWNPVAGCSIMSAGCSNCYAMRMAARLDAMGMEKYRGLTKRSRKQFVWTGEIRLDDKALTIPYGWSKPRFVFVNSMSDLFHEKVPAPFVAQVWRAMEETPRHTYQILTKRPDRMRDIVKHFPRLPNVWLGTSVEGPKVVNRIDELKHVDAVVRFVSFEPLIGAVGEVNLAGVHWAIVGGESGPRARPMQIAWIEQIELACRQADAAFFFKQWGGVRKDRTGRSYKGQTFDEMPRVLAVV